MTRRRTRGAGEVFKAPGRRWAIRWVEAGRSIFELQKILGHYSVVVTERYAHLRPDLFSDGARTALEVDLVDKGTVLPFEKAGR